MEVFKVLLLLWVCEFGYQQYTKLFWIILMVLFSKKSACFRVLSFCFVFALLLLVTNVVRDARYGFSIYISLG